MHYASFPAITTTQRPNTMQSHQRLLLPQAYLTNFHNRVRNEEAIPIYVAAQPSRAHKRAKVVNYAEVDAADPFDFDNDDESDDDSDDSDRAGRSRRRGGAASGRDDSNGIDTDGGDGADGADGAAGEHDGAARGKSGHGSATAPIAMGPESLPDLVEQPEMLGIVRYPRIKETFMQSTVAAPYRLAPMDNTSSTASGNFPEPHTPDEPIIVPVLLSLEHQGATISDFLTWNVNDASLSIEDFATVYCRDLGFDAGAADSDSASAAALHAQVVSAIREQLTEGAKVAAVKLPDVHAVVNLTCNLNDKFYEDNFQWNLSDSSLSPEMFAEVIVGDLGLTRDFLPLIAFSLHDSILKIKREWLEGNLALQETALQNEAAFGYLSGIRLDVDELGVNWCPRVEILTQQEIQKREIEKERNLRRLKRESDRLGRRGRRRMDDLESTLRI